MKEKGYSSYRKERRNDFLQDYKNKYGDNQYYRSLKTVIYRLNDIIDATWRDVHFDKSKYFCIADDFIEVVDKYRYWADNTGHASRTIKNKRYAVSWFLDELSKLQCFSLEQLSLTLITSACVKITNHNLLGEVRVSL